MARTARCPSCGAPVAFKSVVSILAVCDYCQSTLVRQGQDLENLGRMAALLEDRSPVQRGAEGRWHGRHFAVIGRIQLRYEQGLWNEWHLLFDDGKSGWLSEAGGEYVVSEPLWQTDSFPPFAELAVGQRFPIAGRTHAITNLLTAECVAGEGELPFRVGPGYPAPVADLRDEAGGFATLDYSDDPARPLVFLGESVAFETLAWNNLREPGLLPEPTIRARAFDCPKCGAPLQVSHEGVASIGCGSCGAVLDTSDERVRILAEASLDLKVEPLLALGSKGRLRGEDLEVIGFMRRRMEADGLSYYWSEYVLLGPENRLLWLTEYQGHWNLARVLPRSVLVVAGSVRYDKQEFRHFAGYTAHVDYVIGEFPWQVKLDEQAQVADYVSPPRMLSRESTASEETWTLAEYLDPAEIQAAFRPRIALGRPVGVYANQPNPHEETHKRVCRRFWMFLLAAVAIHLVMLMGGSGGALLQQTVVFDPQDDEPRLSREFVIDGADARIEVEHEATLENNWIGLGLTLVNEDTGEAWQASREISYYIGWDEGERWSEGSRSDSVVFSGLPAGRYMLAEDADMDAGSGPIGTRLKVSRVGPRWSSLVVLALLLAAFPIYTRVRRGAFEVKRWAESDHPIVTSSGDDDDD